MKILRKNALQTRDGSHSRRKKKLFVQKLRAATNGRINLGSSGGHSGRMGNLVEIFGELPIKDYFTFPSRTADKSTHDTNSTLVSPPSHRVSFQLAFLFTFPFLWSALNVSCTSFQLTFPLSLLLCCAYTNAYFAFVCYSKLIERLTTIFSVLLLNVTTFHFIRINIEACSLLNFRGTDDRCEGL